MTYASIFVALILAMCVARIIFLNKEIKTLDAASSTFSAVVEGWRASPLKGGVAVEHEMPKEIQEALTEFEWASNARDSKKESRTIWVGAAAVLLIALGTALVEISHNSY